MNHHKSSGLSLGTLIGGIAIGLGLGMLLSPEQKEKARKRVQSGANDLKALLTDPAERERIMDIFGDMTKESKDKYASVKSSLIDSLDGVKNGWQGINKRKYLDLVEGVMDELRAEKKLSVRQINKLFKYLEGDYDKLKNTARAVKDDVEADVKAAKKELA